MQHKHNNSLVPFAKRLRKEMTKAERHLWYDFLRGHSARFSRQKVLGKYIADFYSAKAKLVIKLDGSQHGEEKSHGIRHRANSFFARLRLNGSSHSKQRDLGAFPRGL